MYYFYIYTMLIEDDVTNNDETTINISENQLYNTELIYNPIIELIINCSNNIFRNLGLGFIEYIYHKALLVDLYKTNYNIETKKILPIYYNGINVGYVEPDIIVEDENYYIIIELKAFDKNIGKKKNCKLINILIIFKQKNKSLVLLLILIKILIILILDLSSINLSKFIYTFF